MKGPANFEITNKQPNQQETLAQAFLAGTLAPEAFLQSLMALDQSDPARADARHNIRVLEDPHVANRFIGTEYQNQFYSDLGFYYFHQAQIFESNGLGGLPDFKRALSLSRLAEGSDEGKDDWERYVGATIAYLENDLANLRSLYSETDSNAALVRNLIKGLEQRGEPNYLEDYAAPREK